MGACFMIFNRNFLLFVGIVSLFLFTCKSNAEEMQNCPKGCFCIYDGKLPKRMSMLNVCGTGYVAQRMDCDDSNKVVSFAYAGGAYEGKLSCTRDNQYYFDEFSELYITQHGMYGFLGQDLITMPFFGVTGYGSTVGVYQCPSSYPSSDVGAKTVFDCYKYENGKKNFYTKEQINQVQTTGSDASIEAVKVIIKAGVFDKLNKNKDSGSSEKTQAGLFNKLGKSPRLSSNKQVGAALETSADKTMKTSNNNYLDIDLETAKKMIDAGI